MNQLLNYCSKHKNGGDFRAIKPLQIAPKNARNRISEALKFKIFGGSMPPDPRRYNNNNNIDFGWPLSEPLVVKS